MWQGCKRAQCRTGVCDRCEGAGSVRRVYDEAVSVCCINDGALAVGFTVEFVGVVRCVPESPLNL